ncbi:hypothetical protein MNBD_NITROSPIRAE03-348 [hydrothermal vent metagenome]|uniref:Uncharacterized protein n=1 Tax=hydrothermal vent metagenome TaxID=652676 RepID=A0A3B1D1F5_9ZZZZ
MEVLNSCRNSRLPALVIVLFFCLSLIATGLYIETAAATAGDKPGMSTSAGNPEHTGNPGDGKTRQESTASTIWVIGTIFFIIVAVVGGFAYMYILQQSFLNACREEKQLTLFFQSPAGLPTGTVRSIIALIIIVVCLYLAILLFFRVAGDESEFPEVLSGLLGAVVGFYFGSRTATKGQDVTVGTLGLN